jgi:putative membrane protein
MKSYIHLAAVGVVLTVNPALGQELKPKPASDAAPMMTIDKATFVKMVASSDEFEIQSSKLAKQNSDSDHLKEAAEMIIADHEKAGVKLKSLLEEKKDAPPPAKLAPKHQKMLDQLKAAKAKDFDILYLDTQAQAHMEAVGLFRTYSGAGDDLTLVGFAKETLPRLETHLGHVTMLIMERGG